MAFAGIYFHHPLTGATRKAPVGLSWTTFFWGAFVPLLRGSCKWAALMFVVNMMVILTLGILFMWIPNFVFMFLFNRFYIKELIDDGYRVDQTIGRDLAEIEFYLKMSLPRKE